MKETIELYINIEDLEDYKISLVEQPANETNFFAFANELKIAFAADEDKHIITGVVLIPDMKIYRRNGDKEFYVWFSEDTVKDIAYNFLMDGKVNDFNLNHKTDTESVRIIESFISSIDRERGIDAPAGSWFISAKVDSAEIWNSIKTGKFNGFSLEGTFLFENENDKIIKEAERVVNEHAE